jgi:hypothetical protein
MPLRRQEAKLHKVLNASCIILVILSAFVSLWQKNTVLKGKVYDYNLIVRSYEETKFTSGTGADLFAGAAF